MMSVQWMGVVVMGALAVAAGCGQNRTEEGTGAGAGLGQPVGEGGGGGVVPEGGAGGEGGVVLTGFDALVPDIPAEQCVPEYDWVPAVDESQLKVRRVCASGCEHRTIAEAVEAAEPGEKILVEPGEYRECLRVTTSPIVIEGDGGMARIALDECDYERGLDISSEHVVLRNMDLAYDTGIAVYLRTSVAQATLENMYIHDSDFAVKAASGEVLLRRVKVRDSGRANPGGHQKSVMTLKADVVILERSVFSHYRGLAWLLGASGTEHLEVVCSVIGKVHGLDNEANHSFHIFYPRRLVVSRSFIHEVGQVWMYMYNYGKEPASYHYWGNEFLMDDPGGGFVGIVQPDTMVVAEDNLVVGGKLTEEDYPGNAFVVDRATAGYPPSPELPPHWPVSGL